MRSRRRRWWIAASMMMLIGCASRVAEAPPTIRYNEEPCAQCRMLIGEPRYAAALVTSTGAVEKFDDIGCLLRYRAAHPAAYRRLWVHHYTTEQWLDAVTAQYVVSAELTTPMHYGMVALATADEARSVAGAMHGQLSRFEAVASQHP